MRCDHLLDGLAEVLEQVKPVRHLQRAGGAESCAFGVRPRTVPADHIHSWMRAQPGRQRCCFAAWQDIDGVVAFWRSPSVITVAYA